MRRHGPQCERNATATLLSICDIPTTSPRFLDTDGLVEHLAGHDVTVSEVVEVLRNGATIRRNAKNRRAEMLLQGRTNGGRPLTVAASWAHAPDEDRLYIHTAFETPEEKP